MAIVEMKRVRLLGMASERDALLRVMQRFGCVQVSEVEDAQAYVTGAAPEDGTDRLGRVRWTIGQLNRYDPTKVGFLDSMAMPTATPAQAEQVAAREEELMRVVETVEDLERQSGDLRGREARIRAQVDQLLPWKALDVPVERLGDTRDTLQFVGTVNNRELPPLEEALRDLPATLAHIGDERESAFLWIVAHRSARAQVQEALKAADFSHASFAGEQGTVAQLLDRLHGQTRDIAARRDAIEAELKALGGDVPALKIYYEIISAAVERERAAQRFAGTKQTFLMEGWAPASAAEPLEAALRKVSADLAIDFRDPREGEKPPTMLKNNGIVAPFETVVTSYSYPDPRGLDPTAVMAPFFACLFGMMLSDAGYGLMLVIAIPLIIHFLRPKEGMQKLMKVIFWGGVFTVIWGAVFNTWFGANLPIPTIIDTLNEPIPMLALCLGMGALHLFTGLGVAAYMNIKRGKPLDAFFDQGLWVIMLFGIAFLLLPPLAAVGKWMAIGGAVGIILTAGRSNPKVLGRLMGGFGALYNISSWLSDLLSYMRLFGMGLATGVIGMVINMLIGLIMNAGFVGIIIGCVVFVGGHLFNFAINALGAYVHSCRLQYIEFFSKFYEDGGDPFTPLAQKPFYVAIADASAQGAEK